MCFFPFTSSWLRTFLWCTIKVIVCAGMIISFQHTAHQSHSLDKRWQEQDEISKTADLLTNRYFKFFHSSSCPQIPMCYLDNYTVWQRQDGSKQVPVKRQTHQRRRHVLTRVDCCVLVHLAFCSLACDSVIVHTLDFTRQACGKISNVSG